MRSPILRLIAGFISLLVIAGIVVAVVRILEFVTNAFGQFVARFPIWPIITDYALLILIIVLLSYVLGEIFFKPRVKN